VLGSAAFEPNRRKWFKKISASGGKAIGFATDVTKRAEVGSAHPRGRRRFFRPVSIVLLNNAGYYAHRTDPRPLR